MNYHNLRASSIEIRASSIEHPVSRIENPTLAHFRHFSSLFTPSALYICREPSTNQLFLCKTNPILSAVGGLQMNVNPYNTKDYENISDWTLGENEPKTNPNEPNQSQLKPIKCQNKPNTKPNKANFKGKKIPRHGYFAAWAYSCSLGEPKGALLGLASFLNGLSDCGSATLR